MFSVHVYFNRDTKPKASLFEMVNEFLSFLAAQGLSLYRVVILF